MKKKKKNLNVVGGDVICVCPQKFMGKTRSKFGNNSDLIIIQNYRYLWKLDTYLIYNLTFACASLWTTFLTRLYFNSYLSNNLIGLIPENTFKGLKSLKKL